MCLKHIPAMFLPPPKLRNWPLEKVEEDCNWVGSAVDTPCTAAHQMWANCWAQSSAAKSQRDAPHDLVVGKTSLECDVVHSKDARGELPYAEQERLPPWTVNDIRWTMAIYISVCHLLALAGICMIPWCKVATLLWAVMLWPIGGFGITGGAHRLWAHRSYKASFGFRAVTLVCNSIANQGTIYHWARDHRTHHFHSETCADPHDAGRGFFFAHMGWLFLKKDPR